MLYILLLDDLSIFLVYLALLAVGGAVMSVSKGFGGHVWFALSTLRWPESETLHQ